MTSAPLGAELCPVSGQMVHHSDRSSSKYRGFAYGCNDMARISRLYIDGLGHIILVTLALTSHVAVARAKEPELPSYLSRLYATDSPDTNNNGIGDQWEQERFAWRYRAWPLTKKLSTRRPPKEPRLPALYITPFGDSGWVRIYAVLPRDSTRNLVVSRLECLRPDSSIATTFSYAPDPNGGFANGIIETRRLAAGVYVIRAVTSVGPLFGIMSVPSTSKRRQARSTVPSQQRQPRPRSATRPTSSRPRRWRPTPASCPP